MLVKTAANIAIPAADGEKVVAYLEVYNVTSLFGKLAFSAFGR